MIKSILGLGVFLLQFNAHAAISQIASCSYETEESYFVVGIVEQNGAYFGSVEETWGGGEEFESDEFDLKQVTPGHYLQEGKSENGWVSGFSIELKGKNKARVRMSSTPTSQDPIEFTAECI